jgi:hypothetical protein
MAKLRESIAIDESMFIISRALKVEFRRTHGILFAAAFLDEFEAEIRNVAISSLLSCPHEVRPLT